MQSNRGSIIFGIVLIGLGAWLLAGQLGLAVPGLDQLWPGFVVFGGVLSLISFVRERKPDQMFVGVAAILVGGFFFLFTLGRLDWGEDMRRYWPVFILIFSAASVAQWLSAPSQRGYLAQAALGLFLGLLFLAFNFNILNRTVLQQILQFWPVLLILAGLVTLMRAIRRA